MFERARAFDCENRSIAVVRMRARSLSSGWRYASITWMIAASCGISRAYQNDLSVSRSWTLLQPYQRRMMHGMVRRLLDASCMVAPTCDLVLTGENQTRVALSASTQAAARNATRADAHAALRCDAMRCAALCAVALCYRGSGAQPGVGRSACLYAMNRSRATVLSFSRIVRRKSGSDLCREVCATGYPECCGRS